ncbi:MAG: response regulator [Sandaracinaceae bacterium]|nr:response regulator [Sandaracinaceae bacterium]
MSQQYDPAIHDADTQPLPPRPRTPAAASDVVVVDHDPDVQTRVARTLTDRGSRVVATSSPDAALTLMAQWRPGLVLVNEALPGQSGLELARKIREDHPAAQVVLMTASESPELRASASIVGVLGLLVKPFRLEALFDLLGLSLTPAE